MIGPILLALSWTLLRLEGKGLRALGLDMPRLRVRQFGAGVLLAGLVVLVQQLGYAVAADVPWRVNPAANAALVARSIRWNVNSVLFEELLFRGYVLFQAVRWLGARRAVPLAAAVFGVYHWFSYGVFGHPASMAFVFILTGAFGFMLSLAFTTTKSIALPIGLHLGWNVISYVGFSTGPLGAAILVPGNGAPRMDVTGIPSLVLNLVLPLAFVVGVSGYLVHAHRRSDRQTPAEPTAPVPRIT